METEEKGIKVVKDSPLRTLGMLGQSFWLDYIRRDLIASAKMGDQIYKESFGSDRFRKLAAQGARVQRLLWASTGAKNLNYSDVKYIEALIGPDTVNTAPLETLDAYRDHGEPKARLEQDIEEAHWVLGRLPELGFSIDNVTRQLEDEGVEKFNKSFDNLMEILAQRPIGQT